MTVVDVLARNAREYPDRPAFIEVNRGKNLRKEITWRVLDERTNRIANILIDWGIGKNDKVLHWMKNSITWFEGYFGILKTGAWAVPLNYRFTSADFQHCASITEPKAVLHEEEFTGMIEEVSEVKGAPRLVLGKEGPGADAVIAAASAKPLMIEMTRDDDCSLYFTSGTTGDPKPILHTHRSLEWLGVIGCTNFRLTNRDHFIIITPLYHLGAFGWWLGSFLTGACATILTDFSPKNYLETVAAEKATWAFLPVPWTQDILGALDTGELKKADYDLSGWRVLLMGAQPIAASIVWHWKEYFPEMEYHTTYGASEAGFSFHLDPLDSHKIGSVGKPSIGWDARIVNDAGVDVPLGEAGEPVTRGNATMREYYKNPRKTAEVIRNGWYHTGDLAKKDEDGFTYIVGRRKDVIISGGENIYPEEVEETIQAHPKVEDVAVIGLPDPRSGEMAVAVIQVKANETLTVAECEAYCEKELPRYKRPKRIIFDAVPRNAAGKIEKLVLKEKYG